jgi:hypothetical protein
MLILAVGASVILCFCCSAALFGAYNLSDDFKAWVDDMFNWDGGDGGTSSETGPTDTSQPIQYDCSQPWATCPSKATGHCYWGDQSHNKGFCCKTPFADKTDCVTPPKTMPSASNIRQGYNCSNPIATCGGAAGKLSGFCFWGATPETLAMCCKNPYADKKDCIPRPPAKQADGSVCPLDKPLKCSAGCTNVLIDKDNCGKCGNKCGAGTKCSVGVCVKR